MNYFKEIIDDIQSQFNQLTDKIIVCDEQMFFSSTPEVDKMYAVVKFNSASSNFAQVSLPITIYLWGTANNVEEVKNLSLQYTITYNIYSKDNKTQFYSTPTVIQNFTEQGSSFRSLYYFSGQFIFGKNANKIISIVYEDQNGNLNNCDILSAKFNLSNTPNTQPMPGNNGITTTVNQFGTISLGFSTYLTTVNKLVDDVLNNILNLNDFINETYTLYILFNSQIEGHFKGELDEIPSDLTNYAIGDIYIINKTYYKVVTIESQKAIIAAGLKLNMKLVSYDVNQSIGALPSVALAFTI